MQRLEDKVAVITGGNSGIGRATAKLFAEEGARVIITGRRQDVVDQAVRDIGHHALGVVGDVADLEHHHRVADMIQNRFGGVDIYMANAGVISLVPVHKRLFFRVLEVFCSLKPVFFREA
jgi:NAD(P)-dependent dehydrogenase (short-subunit alcohol dehydrogenase family)